MEPPASSPSLRRTELLLGLLAIGLALFILVGLALRAVWREPSHIPFESGVWRSRDHVARGEMLQDLLDRHLRAGMPESEVLELLGPPERTARECSIWILCVYPENSTKLDSAVGRDLRVCWTASRTVAAIDFPP